MAHGNFTLRGFLADMREEDPRRCWPFQSIVDYHEFRRISSTPAPSNAQINQQGSVVGSTSIEASERQRNQNGTVVGPENPEVSLCGSLTASKRKEVGSENPAASGVERKKKRKGKQVIPADSDDDDIPLGEWLKRQGLKVQASNVALAKPQLADSSSGLVTIEVMVGVSGAGVQAPTMALAEPRPASLFSGLELLSSVALRPEPVAELGGASVQAPEEARPNVSAGRLQPRRLRSRMRGPGVGTRGTRVQAAVTAPAGPREHEVMVCRVSRNPAELSPEVSKFYLRGL